MPSRMIGNGYVVGFSAKCGEFLNQPPAIGSHRAGVGDLGPGQGEGGGLVRTFSAGEDLI